MSIQIALLSSSAINDVLRVGTSRTNNKKEEQEMTKKTKTNSSNRKWVSEITRLLNTDLSDTVSIMANGTIQEVDDNLMLERYARASERYL